jgi:hypothetical protein
MPSLLDIAAATDEVHGITVYGVSARGIASLLARFPDLRKMMAGREVTSEALFEMAPEAISHIIACGLNKPGDEETIAAADSLSLDVQLDFLTAILKLTMPQGLGPFAERLAKLTAVVGAEASPVVAAATTSPKPSKP